MLELIEYIDVDLVKGTEQLKKLAKGILEVVFLSQLEDRLVYFAAEPNDCLADQLGSPVARADCPRCDGPGQQGSGHLIRVEADVVVPLKECRRAGIVYRTFDDTLDHVCLVLSPRHEDDLTGSHHCPDTHGDGGFGRDRHVSVEIAGLGLS